MPGTRIVKKISKEEFKEIREKYKKGIVVSPDALFRLSEGQRKVFKEESLIAILTKENPRSIGLQQNGRYAAFFRRKDGFMRIIFILEGDTKLEIITFFTTANMPIIKNDE